MKMTNFWNEKPKNEILSYKLQATLQNPNSVSELVESLPVIEEPKIE